MGEGGRRRRAWWFFFWGRKEEEKKKDGGSGGVVSGVGAGEIGMGTPPPLGWGVCVYRRCWIWGLMGGCALVDT